MDLQLAWMLWARGGDVCAFVCCIWAFWRGGITERIGATIIGIAWALSFWLTEHKGNGLGPYVLTIDIVTLIALGALAIWSRRLWVFFATACMINALVSHFTPHIAGVGIYSYVTAVGMWSGWLLLICLAWGIISYRRGLKRKRDDDPKDPE